LAGYGRGEEEDCVQLIKGSHTQYSELSFWIAQQNVADIKDLKSQVEDLAFQVANLASLKDDVRNFGTSMMSLVGVLCALWAQNTHRNAWLWFFLGACFPPIAAILLLFKNSADRKLQR